ncbi:esterase [Clostridium botulinum]|uniref:esterase n=1 Tax=Clostridium botulinum TaxID=1491 RepID=UPI000D13B017|nr:esterase [Clostridium botulinum]AVQ45687.1 esterase [Clostridium botulinum]AVQ49626.1 esterase [Clostridium botulinum]
MDLNITNIEDLKKVAQGEVIQLPQFSQGIPFNARVKRVSLLNLVRKGVVPNKLLSAAEELFYGKQSSKENVDLAQMTDVMYIMAENALVEPSIEDLKSVGLELTDEQIVALFNYTQEGVSELDSFREESENTERNINK